MKPGLWTNRDFMGGLMLMVIGGGAMFIAKDYRFGSTLSMGPGYFPVVLGGVLFLFGVIIMVKGLLRAERIQTSWSPRALITLSLSLLLFGILMQYAGFIPALAVLVFGSAASSKEFKFFEVLLLTVLLTVLSVGVFIWGIGLPYPLIKGF